MPSNSQEQFIEKKFGALSFGHLTSAPLLSKSVSISSGTDITISATQLLSGTIIRAGDSSTATDTLPAASDVLARLNVLTNSQASVGMSFDCNIFNKNGGTLTFSTVGSDSSNAGTNTMGTLVFRKLTGVVSSISGTTGTIMYNL